MQLQHFGDSKIKTLNFTSVLVLFNDTKIFKRGVEWSLSLQKHIIYIFHLPSFMTTIGVDREYFSCFYCCMSVTIMEWARLGGPTAGHIVQLLCAIRIILEIVTHACVQMAFEYLQWRSLHSFSGKLMLRVKKFSYSDMFQFHKSCSKVSSRYASVKGITRQEERIIF